MLGLASSSEAGKLWSISIDHAMIYRNYEFKCAQTNFPDSDSIYHNIFIIST